MLEINPEKMPEAKYLFDLKDFFDQRLVDQNNKPLFDIKFVSEPNKLAGGWYKPLEKTIYINTVYATKETMFHEFSHPILEYIDRVDSKKFDELYD